MPARRSYFLWYGLGTATVGLLLLPLFEPAWFETPLFANHAFLAGLARLGLLALTPLMAWLATRGEQLVAKERRWVLFLALAAAVVGEAIHFWAIDRGNYHPGTEFADNTAWQLYMHRQILALNPAVLPHCYRFLPDSIVAIFWWLCGSFELSRIAYRLLFDALIFVCAYRCARVYLSDLFAGGVVLALAVLYPVSILNYGGQLTDPASHFSFAICLFCLLRRYEPAFGPNLFAGLLAKESVIVLAACRLFTGASRRRAVILATLYAVVALVLVVGVRLYVNHGAMHYRQISGVGLGHIRTNLAQIDRWGPSYLVTFGALLPGTVLGWRLMDRGFQLTCAVLLVSLFVSSLLFSWLTEVRNYVPAFLLLVIVNLRYLEAILGRAPASVPATGPLAPRAAP